MNEEYQWDMPRNLYIPKVNKDAREPNPVDLMAEEIYKLKSEKKALLKELKGAATMLWAISIGAKGSLKNNTEWKVEVLEKVIAKAEGRES